MSKLSGFGGGIGTGNCNGIGYVTSIFGFRLLAILSA